MRRGKDNCAGHNQGLLDPPRQTWQHVVDFGFKEQNPERSFVGVVSVRRLEGAALALCIPVA